MFRQEGVERLCVGSSLRSVPSSKGANVAIDLGRGLPNDRCPEGLSDASEMADPG